MTGTIVVSVSSNRLFLTNLARGAGSFFATLVRKTLKLLRPEEDSLEAMLRIRSKCPCMDVIFYHNHGMRVVFARHVNARELAPKILWWQTRLSDAGGLSLVRKG